MNTTTSTRPFNLPADLPDPPQPPAGHRGVYRGLEWESASDGISFIVSGGVRWERFIGPAMGSVGLQYIEYIPLRPTPEGVTDVPEGWEYVSQGPLGNCFGQHPDLAALWSKGWEPNVYGGTGLHYALRIGSEIHHRHFDYGDANRAIEADFVEKSPAAIAAVQKLVDSEVARRNKPPVAANPAVVETVKPCNYYDPDPFGAAPEPHPAKAREWVLRPHAMGVCAVVHYGPVPEPKEEIHVREILPNEQALLEEARADLKNTREELGQFREDYMLVTSRLDGHTASECFMNLNVVIDDLKSKGELLEEAVGHLRAMLLTAESNSDRLEAWAWLDEHFPAPAPEPALFDKWYANWAGVFANKEQAAAMFKEAQRPTQGSQDHE